MPYLNTGDVDLYFSDEGSGPPVLMVHGWTCDGHDWQYQVPAFLDAGYRVIVPDLRGHGRSSVPQDGYSERHFAGDLAALLTALGTGPVIAIGHSLGGLVVSALAVEHPGLVRALVPVDSAYGIEGPLVELFHQLSHALADPATAHETAWGALAATYTAASPRHLIAWHRRRLFGCPHHVLHAAFADMIRVPGGVVLRPDADAYMARRSCPVLSFYASPLRAAWESVTFSDSRSRTIAWEGSGHWLHQERPDEFNAVVLEWLKGLEAK